MMWTKRVDNRIQNNTFRLQLEDEMNQVKIYSDRIKVVTIFKKKMVM